MEVRRVQPGLVWVLNGQLQMAREVGELALELGVTGATIRRWCRGDKIPRTVQLALKFLLGEFHHPAWQQAHVSERDGKLWMWNGVGFHPGELENVALIYQTNRALWKSVSPESHTTMAEAMAARQVTQEGECGVQKVASL